MNHLTHLAAALLGVAACPALAAAPVPAASDQPAAARIDPATGGLVANLGDLTIEFANIGPAQGQILVALFASADAFDRGGTPVRVVAVPAAGPIATAAIANLAHGRYGMKIHHDVNGDGKLNANPFGMPIEPFAFSNNAVSQMGPAKWADAAFDVTGPTIQTINFR